ncbi:MAG: YceI family protein [Bacteroidota bacterium]
MQKLICILILMTSLSLTGQTQQTYPLNVEKSVLNWKGTYAFQFSEHSGTVSFKEGQLHAENGHLKSGRFIIDMNSITNEDYERKQGPVKHLKDSDFFDVTKFPEAKLVINKVTYFIDGNQHKMEGQLTIKGISKPIEFWATIDATTKIMHTRFKIDRRDWGIVYNNKLKNHSISDAIEFEAELFF